MFYRVFFELILILILLAGCVSPTPVNLTVTKELSSSSEPKPFTDSPATQPVPLPKTQESPAATETPLITLTSPVSTPAGTIISTSPALLPSPPSSPSTSSHPSQSISSLPTPTRPLPPPDTFIKGFFFADWGPKVMPPSLSTGTAVPKPPRPSLGLYNAPEADESMKNLAATGTNWIGLNVECLQETYTSIRILREPPCTATDAELARMIDLAHSLGMRVMMRPQVGISINDPDHWSGDIGTAFNTETQWQDWFTSYRDFINHYADFSQKTGADMLCLGVELGGATHREDDWRRVIKEVRERYKGPITYSSLSSSAGANTIFPHGEEKRIKWWDAVDYIGVSAYYKLTYENNPSLAELKAAWTDKGYVALLENLSKKFNKPIIFTEIGYESRDGTNIQPAHGILAFTTRDLNEQASCYQAVMEVMFEKPWFKGMFWFQWLAKLNAAEASPTGTGFMPWGKPAEAVLKKFYLEDNK